MHYVHESSFIGKGATIGNGTRIWHFSHISPGAIIGSDVTIGQNCFIAPNVIIGDRCKIQNNVSIYEGVTLGNDVFIGPSVVFTNVKIPRAFIDRKNKFVATYILDGASIGANATIICGVTISNLAVVGAGAVVSKNVMSRGVVVGPQTTQLGDACDCGATMFKTGWTDIAVECPECSATYTRKGINWEKDINSTE